MHIQQPIDTKKWITTESICSHKMHMRQINRFNQTQCLMFFLLLLVIFFSYCYLCVDVVIFLYSSHICCHFVVAVVTIVCWCCSCNHYFFLFLFLVVYIFVRFDIHGYTCIVLVFYIASIASINKINARKDEVCKKRDETREKYIYNWHSSWVVRIIIITIFRWCIFFVVNFYISIAICERVERLHSLYHRQTCTHHHIIGFRIITSVESTDSAWRLHSKHSDVDMTEFQHKLRTEFYNISMIHCAFLNIFERESNMATIVTNEFTFIFGENSPKLKNIHKKFYFCFVSEFVEFKQCPTTFISNWTHFVLYIL